MKKLFLTITILSLTACATPNRGAQFKAAFVGGKTPQSAITQEANWGNTFGDPHAGFYHGFH